MKSSATSGKISMGPLRCFSSTHQRNSGPMQNYWPLLWRDQWAHTDALARCIKEILGLSEVISHFSKEIYGPMKMLWQHSLKKSWAHAKTSATSVRRSMGPLRFSKTHQKHYGLTKNYCCFTGPIQDYFHRYSVLYVGPFRIISNTIQCWLWAYPTLLISLLHVKNTSGKALEWQSTTGTVDGGIRLIFSEGKV